MSARVSLPSFGATLEVELGTTVLDAALDAGIAYPHSCRAGNCSSCKSELIAGEVELLEYSEFALSDDERAAGKILACRASVWSDCTVRPLDDEELDAFPQRTLRCRIESLTRAAHDVVIVGLTIEHGGPFLYAPGQYAAVQFGGAPARDFSMARPPGSDVIEFHVRVQNGGAASAYVAEHARPGDAALVRGPFGTAHLRERHTGPVVLAGGGTGLAPVLAILERIVALEPGRRVDVYVGVRDIADLYADERLVALTRRTPNVRVHRVLSAPTGAHAFRSGNLCDALAADALDVRGAKAYLAGPPVMVDTCVAVLERLGVPRSDIHADAFFAATAGGAA